MIPLSCVNCCHNPLQLGPVGTAFGYCTTHRLVLTQPQSTTCGQLLRKDLLAESAAREQKAHARTYRKDVVSLVNAPDKDATNHSLVEKANGQMPADDVIDEVLGYGQLDSKIATMAALHRIPGSRAEVAMLSLSRGYFRNCTRTKKGPWTAGVHLLFWTLSRLETDPRIEATDLRGPIAYSLAHTIAVARWTILALRLAFVADVGRRALEVDDPVGRLAALPYNAVDAAPGPDPDRLLAWLTKTKRQWMKPLSPTRYADLREQLHDSDDKT